MKEKSNQMVPRLELKCLKESANTYWWKSEDYLPEEYDDQSEPDKIACHHKEDLSIVGISHSGSYLKFLFEDGT